MVKTLNFAKAIDWLKALFATVPEESSIARDRDAARAFNDSFDPRPDRDHLFEILTAFAQSLGFEVTTTRAKMCCGNSLVDTMRKVTHDPIALGQTHACKKHKERSIWINDDLLPLQQVRTLFHELAHVLQARFEAGSKDEFVTGFLDSMGPSETIAEGVAALCCKVLHIRNTFSVPYLAEYGVGLDSNKQYAELVTPLVVFHANLILTELQKKGIRIDSSLMIEGGDHDH